MSLTPLHILVDDREDRTSIAMRLAASGEVRITRKRLKTGDYLIEGRVIAERKRIPDFLASLCDGRPFRQAYRLANCGLRGLMIIEGSGSEWKQTGIHRAAIQGALLTLGIVFDLQILRAMDEAETSRILLLAARQICRSARSSIRRPGWRPRAKRGRQLFILTSLSGVGATRALALLNHFGSVERVLSAPQADLLGIEGIGPRTAIAIRDAVSEDLTFYK